MRDIPFLLFVAIFISFGYWYLKVYVHNLNLENNNTISYKVLTKDKQIKDLQDRVKELEATKARMKIVYDDLWMNYNKLFINWSLGYPNKDSELNLPEGVVIRDLIKLCHPDRHVNSEQKQRAEKVTAWLLTLDKKKKR